MTSDSIEVRTVRLANLLLASGILLICLAGEVRWGYRDYFPDAKPDSLAPFRGIMMDSVAVTWFTGAIGLLYRKRFAWIASFVGAGALGGFFIYGLIVLGWLCYRPNAELIRVKSQGGPIILSWLVLGAIGASLFVLLLSR
jgi:hypothetical protein